jgi:hypothetical protein
VINMCKVPKLQVTCSIKLQKFQSSTKNKKMLMIGVISDPTLAINHWHELHMLRNYCITLLLFILIQGFSICYLSLLNTELRNNSFIHEVDYVKHCTLHVHLSLLNGPYYFMHLLLCKLYLLFYIHEVNVIEILCYNYLILLFWSRTIWLCEIMIMTLYASINNKFRSTRMLLYHFYHRDKHKLSLGIWCM